ncbi:glycosyl hydrolase family 28 protein [Sphingobium sp. Sx8-8]|uniref:glycoside hydrolase family 28 protein n=1 Tax=Sphingobium sp. Sx8-8 TaxID=2933617 RepID=UPI001F5AE026|nr:glycosyl hydrolase family 28 protein [Sphingobium sp. Sx8-8]
MTARLAAANGSIDAEDADPHRSRPDQQRIQSAINACPHGSAVRLVAIAGRDGFLSGPLLLKSGVTLWIDRGVTLFASRSPADYDNGSGHCGTATQQRERDCTPFITARKTSGSGIVGDGAIDGRGGSLLTSGPNAGRRSWWDVAFQNKTERLYQQNPLLIDVVGGDHFTLYRVKMMNAPNFHFLSDGTSTITAWNIKILSPSRVYTRPGYRCPADTTPDKATPATCFTPDTVKNTDGFDPGQSDHVLLTQSYISVGDDNVAVKSHGRISSRNLAFVDNHFYYGHGMSIGSETDSGVSTMIVRGLAVDGSDAVTSTGIRIKSDSSRGGLVSGVSYDRICLRNIRYPMVFTAYYSKDAQGQKPPRFQNISVHDFHDLGSARYGGGEVTLTGRTGVSGALELNLDNVVIEGRVTISGPPHNAPNASGMGAASRVILGPGPVSFADALSRAPGMAIQYRHDGGPMGAVALDCSHAFVDMAAVVPEAPF